MVQSQKSVAFLILRHVNDARTNEYWIYSQNCIRRFYPENLIIIIDDNSDTKFLTNPPLKNVKIIKSEYPKRGELLPYIYASREKFADTIVILHDSTFLNKPIDLSVDTQKFIWEFEHKWDLPAAEIDLLRVFDDEKLIELQNKKDEWKGAFGAMAIISSDFLQKVNQTQKFEKLVEKIDCRNQRSRFERVIAILFTMYGKTKPLLADIHKQCNWGRIFWETREKTSNLPITKVWTGR